jgi:hypothetical protein
MKFVHALTYRALGSIFPLTHSVTRLCKIFAIGATLGYFLLDQFSPKQAVSTNGLLWVFWTFKLSFNADILTFLATLPKNWAKFSSIFRSHCLPPKNSFAVQNLNFAIEKKMRKCCSDQLLHMLRLRHLNFGSW